MPNNLGMGNSGVSRRPLALLLILLLISLAANLYFIAGRAPVQQPTGSLMYSFDGFRLSPSNVENFIKVISFNGTALVTGRIVATAPIDFNITKLGPGGLLVFAALNATAVNIWVLLPQAAWSFNFFNTGVDSKVTLARITLNYSYLAN